MFAEKVTAVGALGIESTARADAPPVSLNWIANPRMDLLWFIGGAMTGYALFFVPTALGWNMLTVWVVWYVLLDVPHFFGTYLRTYLDREEMRRRRPLLLGSLGWLGIGPLTALASYAMFASASEALSRHYLVPFEILMAFLSFWAYWHVVRQHYGFLALYKRKNNDLAPPDNRIDKTLLYVGLLAPLLALILRHRESREVFRMPREGPQPWEWDYVLVALTLAAVVLAALVFAVRQAQLWQRGESINLPKVLFLLAVVPLHVFLAYHPAVLAASLLTFSACVTIYHDVQYHAIVWHTQSKRFGQPGAHFQRHGLAALVGKRFPIYMACAVAMGIGTWLASCILGILHGGCGVPGYVWKAPLLGEIVLQNPIDAIRSALGNLEMPLFGEITLQAFFGYVAVGFIMHHYFVDQFIWRPSKDANLSRQLELAPTVRA